MEDIQESVEIDEVDEPFDPSDFYLGLCRPGLPSSQTTSEGLIDKDDDLFGDGVRITSTI